MKIKLEMKPVQEVVRRLGLDSAGGAQRFHTNNVMRRIVKYLPYKTGETIKIMHNQTDISRPAIVLDVPYAKYLYYGKVMVGPAPKRVTEKNIEYNTDKNPLAGPFWDRRLVAAEGAVLAEELEAYIKRGK